MTRVLVTGGAGFIGGHLCEYLKDRGYWVRAVDWRPPEHRTHVVCDEYDWQCDLRHYENAVWALRGIDEVYALAADMGGMGFISTNHYEILQHNLRINLNTAEAARIHGIRRLFYSSSACVYPERLQLTTTARNLAESDAWDGKPDTAYGIEKLAGEELYERLAEEGRIVIHAAEETGVEVYLQLSEQHGVEVRIARFHNVYGPWGPWEGGREKSPAAMCRKAAEARREGHNRIEVWGDGKATRSFCYIDDCLEMIHRLMRSNYALPMNIGTDTLVEIDYLAAIAGHCAGFEPELVHVPGPQGVRGRNADLTRMREWLDYESQVSLEEGMQRTYDWIEEQMQK